MRWRSLAASWSTRLPQNSGARLASVLLAGAAAVIATPEPLPAQTYPLTSSALAPTAPPPAPPRNDGLAGGGFYLEADTLINDDAHHRVVARGSVEARYKGRVLRADELDYDRTTGVVTAHGHVAIVNPDGTSQFARDITLDKDMSEGVAIGFSARLASNVKIAADEVQRKSALVTELNRAVYTPCPVCADNHASAPTWSIRARQVVEDKKRKTLAFRGAVLQVKGIDLLYVPVFWTADPTADRKSGLLLPVVTYSDKRGLSWDQPYYQVITPSSDITITPQINTKVNPFLTIDWRKRFYSGAMDVRAGYTYDQDFTSGGDKFGPLTSRSFILASGLFDLSPQWEWGFTAERASDRLIFDKYGIGNVFVDRGLYAADDRRLISQIYAIRQDSDSYISAAAIAIQGLREPGGGLPGDLQSTFPFVAPLIEARWDPSTPILGGRLRMIGGGVVLTRDRYEFDPTLPGIDSRRASVDGDWMRTFTLANGIRLAPFADGRVDLYSISNVNGVKGQDATIGRAFGVVGLNATWPFIRQDKGVSWILEPMAQLAIANNPSIDKRIPNEDSQIFEFDETNLFEFNKSPGYDIYDGGQKLNLGVRGTALFDDGASASVIIGRSIRFEKAPYLPERTGLRTALSDWIIGAEATPRPGITVFSRWRLDSTTYAINELETGAEFTTSRIIGYASYLDEKRSPSGLPVKSIDLHGEAFFTRHWGLDVYAIRDIDQGDWRKRDFGLVYRDDCVRFEILWRREETFNGTLGPSNSVVLRLSLSTLGAATTAGPALAEPPID
ncbi:MAG TPA: LPS assembly protein LptD [Caulobacteraceae bacterium]|nr:LPS assembly protein LptD [Caulobacteraceae bacterium]